MPDTPESPGAPLTILAFDFGQRRIGVAVGQAVTASASPVGSARNGDQGPDWTQIGRWVKEWQPGRLVVGLPLHADGSDSAVTTLAREFAIELRRYNLPLAMIDERYSSIEAEQQLRQARADGRRGRIRKQDIDAAAAVMIAERWLAENS